MYQKKIYGIIIFLWGETEHNIVLKTY